MSRKLWIKLRVSEAEKAEFEAKAQDAGMTLADLIRHRLLQYRLRKTPEEREAIRLIARAGANLNQIARWANTYTREIETVQTMRWIDAVRHNALTEIERRGSAGSNANRRDRQRDARRDILSHFAVLQNGPAGQAVYFADGSPFGPFRCPLRREKVGSKPCFRFTQTSCPAGLKAGSRGSQ